MKTFMYCILGQYEETISRTYTNSANLRGILHKLECPQALQQSQPMFEKLLNPQIRDTLVTDMLSLSTLSDEDYDCESDTLAWDERTARLIPLDLYNALSKSIVPTSPRKAQFLSHLTIGGLTYTVASKHIGNSHALIKADSSDHNALIPIRIDYIFQVCVSDTIQTFLGARCYNHSGIITDPFRCFPILQATMWNNELGAIKILTPDCICAHFAKASMVWEGVDRLVVLSLCRVSQSCNCCRANFLTIP